MRSNRQTSNYLNTIVPSAGGAIGCEPPQHIRAGAWRRLRGVPGSSCDRAPRGRRLSEKLDLFAGGLELPSAVRVGAGTSCSCATTPWGGGAWGARRPPPPSEVASEKPTAPAATCDVRNDVESGNARQLLCSPGTFLRPAIRSSNVRFRGISAITRSNQRTNRGNCS